MRSDILPLLHSITQKGLLVLSSFLDEILLLGLNKMGINLPGLQWISVLLLWGAILYWSLRLARVLYQRYRAN